MGERKGVNKWYPPDYDPSKGSINKHVGQHPLRERAKKISQGILVIRFEMPYNIWCGGCGIHIAMGVRYNAEKKKVDKYYTTPIYEFRMRCHLCPQYFTIRTDPKNHDYVITDGARRKEQRWDPHENEQIVPEDRATHKKLVNDSMYLLEHGTDDKGISKKRANNIARVADLQDRWQDDYMINKLARAKFRGEKKEILNKDLVDKALLKKSCLNIKLADETDADKKLAGLLHYTNTETPDILRKRKRQEIDDRPLFGSSSNSGVGNITAKRKKLGLVKKSCSSTTTSPSKICNVESNRESDSKMFGPKIDAQAKMLEHSEYTPETKLQTDEISVDANVISSSSNAAPKSNDSEINCSVPLEVIADHIAHNENSNIVDKTDAQSVNHELNCLLVNEHISSEINVDEINSQNNVIQIEDDTINDEENSSETFESVDKNTLQNNVTETEGDTIINASLSSLVDYASDSESSVE